MSNVTALMRQGWLYGSTWGLIDDLTMEYEGNRLAKCDDDVSAQPTYNAAHHFHGRRLEFRIPRDRYGNFHPQILAILRGQE